MHAHKHHGRPHFRPNPMFAAFVIVESLFWALAATCVLSALQRIAGALKLRSRMEALEKHADAFTEEERERLIHKIKASALGCM